MLGSAAFRTGVAPGGALAPGWVKNELWRKARTVPSLDLRFADDKSLVDATTGASLVTFTRASSGTFVGSDGVLGTAATNEPRFDHNPTTGESLGLLVEEQRTNSVTNNTMVGAVAGTPGTNPTGWSFVTAQSNGLTISIVGTGVESGINYIDYRFNGTTVASPNACAFGFTSAAAATSQTWATSLYWKLVSGTTTGTINWQLGIIENTAGGAFVAGAFYNQTTPTSAALITQRPTATRTLSGGVTVGQVSHIMNIPVTGNTAIDFTIRIGLPQLEQGAFATSPILTSTAAATRSADVASITGTAFSSWYRQDEGTVFVNGSAPRVVESAGGFLTLNDPAGGNRIDIRQYRHQPFLQGGGGSSTTWSGILPTITPNVNFMQAVAYSSSSQGNAISGVLEQSTTALLPIVATRMALAMRDGQTAPSGNTGGTFKRICFWPQRLANNTLQSITQ